MFFLAGEAAPGRLGGGWSCVSEGSVFNAAAAAAAKAMAAASSRLRLNNPGDSTASADDGKGEPVGKNLEDAAGTGAAGGAGVEVAEEAGAAGAVDLGFVKKPRMSMSQITSSRDIICRAGQRNFLSAPYSTAEATNQALRRKSGRTRYRHAPLDKAPKSNVEQKVSLEFQRFPSTCSRRGPRLLPRFFTIQKKAHQKAEVE